MLLLHRKNRELQTLNGNTFNFLSLNLQLPDLSSASHPSLSGSDMVVAFRQTFHRESTSAITNWLWLSPSNNAIFNCLGAVVHMNKSHLGLNWSDILIYAARTEGNIRFCNVDFPCPWITYIRIFRCICLKWRFPLTAPSFTRNGFKDSAI